MSSSALLAATGQTKSLRRCAILAGLGLGATVGAPVLMFSDHSLVAIGLFLIGAVLLLGSMLYALKRTVCPNCQTPWLRYAVGEKSVNGWLAWLTTFTNCPKCGLSTRDTAKLKAMNE